MGGPPPQQSIAGAVRAERKLTRDALGQNPALLGVGFEGSDRAPFAAIAILLTLRQQRFPERAFGIGSQVEVGFDMIDMEEHQTRGPLCVTLAQGRNDVAVLVVATA